MPVFAYTIAADQHRPSEGDGFVRAETIGQAVALVGHPDANVQTNSSPGVTLKSERNRHKLNRDRASSPDGLAGIPDQPQA
jgi:hypothetical protein